MKGAQLIVVILIMLLVGAGVAVVVIASQPDASEIQAYQAKIAKLEDDVKAYRTRIDKLEENAAEQIDPSRFDLLEERVSSIPRGSKGISGIKKDMGVLEKRIDKLEKHLAEGMSMEGSEGTAERPLDKLIEGIEKNPEKLFMGFAKGMASRGKDMLLNRMKTELELRDDQAEAVKDLLDKGIKKLFSKESGDLSFAEMRKRWENNQGEFKEAMRELLDDEQFEKFEKMQSERRGGMMWGRGPRGGGEEGSGPEE